MNRDLQLTPNDVPSGVPGHGERVSSDPADVIRDVFLLHKGRLTERQTEALIGRLSFTYGHKVHKAWAELLEDEMWVRDGDDYVNPIQESMAVRDMAYGIMSNERVTKLAEAGAATGQKAQEARADLIELVYELLGGTWSFGHAQNLAIYEDAKRVKAYLVHYARSIAAQS